MFNNPNPQSGELHADVVMRAKDKISSIAVGEQLVFEGIDGCCFNNLYVHFQPERDGGKLRFDFDQANQVLTVSDERAPEPAPTPEPAPAPEPEEDE